MDFLTGTLILSGVSDDAPFSIVIKGRETPGLTQGAFVVPLTGGGSRRVLRETLAGEVTIHGMASGGANSRTPLATGVLEPGGTLELSIQ